jgi:hypothetical protein
MKFSEFEAKRSRVPGPESRVKTSPPAETQRRREDPKNPSAKDLSFYTGMLLSEECLCGKTKLRKNTFCYKCFKALPDDMGRALYRSMGRWYEQAVDEATVWLQRNVW